MTADYAVTAIAGYLLGSLPVARIVAARHGVDLARTGDGNPGAWNALEQLGARRAWPVFAGDGAKAVVAALIGWALGGWWLAWIGVAAAMVGHALPVFARGRGGKSVMCFAGGACVLSPLAAVFCASLTAAFAASGRGALGARAGIFMFPVAELATDPISHVAATGALMTFIGILFVARRRKPGRATAGAGPQPRG